MFELQMVFILFRFRQVFLMLVIVPLIVLAAVNGR